jgi:ankyrin repeat protein
MKNLSAAFCGCDPENCWAENLCTVSDKCLYDYGCILSQNDGALMWASIIMGFGYLYCFCLALKFLCIECSSSQKAFMDHINEVNVALVYVIGANFFRGLVVILKKVDYNAPPQLVMEGSYEMLYVTVAFYIIKFNSLIINFFIRKKSWATRAVGKTTKRYIPTLVSFLIIVRTILRLAIGRDDHQSILLLRVILTIIFVTVFSLAAMMVRDTRKAMSTMAATDRLGDDIKDRIQKVNGYIINIFIFICLWFVAYLVRYLIGTISASGEKNNLGKSTKMKDRDPITWNLTNLPSEIFECGTFIVIAYAIGYIKSSKRRNPEHVSTGSVSFSEQAKSEKKLHISSSAGSSQENFLSVVSTGVDEDAPDGKDSQKSSVVHAFQVTNNPPRHRRRLSVFKYKAKRKASMVGHKAENCITKYPRCVQFLEFLWGTGGIVLYFYDVYTDIQLCSIFYQFGHYDWFWLLFLFIAIPYLIAMIGVEHFITFRIAAGEEIFFFGYALVPIAPLFFDILMPFYSFMGKCLPDGLMNFMVQYEATRTFSETFLEAIPQLVLQFTIIGYCASSNQNCQGIEQVAGEALIQSIVASGLVIIYRLVTVYLEMKNEGLSFKSYLKSLVQMGAGLPLRAITENAVKHVMVHGTLLDSEIRSLAKSMKENTSIETINFYPALVWAKSKGHQPIVEVLLNNKAVNYTNDVKVNRAFKNGMTSLHHASHDGRTEMAKLLLNMEAIDVNKADKYGNTPLCCASANGHTDIVKLLLTMEGIDVNKADGGSVVDLSMDELLENNGKYRTNGETPLCSAFRAGHKEIIKLLLDVKGIDVNKADKDGATPLTELHLSCT